MSSAFCGLPTHMVHVAIWSCAPPPSIVLGLVGRCGQRETENSSRDRPQLQGGLYGACYDCHEIRATATNSECGITQVVLVHV